MSKLIGIAGKAEAGKSTIAKALKLEIKERFDEDYEIVSFATPLKLMVEALLNYVDAPMPEKTEVFLDTGKTLRYVYQTIGTEWGRKLINEHLWTSLVQRKYVDKGINIIIDDLRFQNELFWIKSHPESISLYLKRDGTKIPEASHISENDLHYYMCDQVLENNGNIQSLTNKIIKKIEVGNKTLDFVIDEKISKKQVLFKSKIIGKIFRILS